jgi:hypothetical protein
MNKNTIEIADVLDFSYYTPGANGKEALLKMLAAAYSQLAALPIDSPGTDWLANPDGSEGTIADVLDGVALVARRYVDEDLLDVDASDYGSESARPSGSLNL